MCGYFNDSMWQKVSDEDLLIQFNTAMNSYSDQKFVKIFTSGSFLDDKEISQKVRREIFSKLVETADKISVESRPEFITDISLSELKKINDSKIFEIGVGLETAKELDLSWFQYQSRIGVTAGASTPDKVINEVVLTIEEMGLLFRRGVALKG